VASFKKRTNKKGEVSYQATIYVGRDAAGKQVFEYVTRPTLKECKAAAREVEQEIQEGRYINLGNMRLAAWVDKWLELNEARLSPSTLVSYRIYADVHYKPYFGQIKLKQLSELHIREYLNGKLKVLSPTTVRKHFFVLRRMLQDIMKHKNPAKDIPAPVAEDYQPRVPTAAEFLTLLESVRGTRDEIVILLAGWCGLRRGEIFALKWDDIDYEGLTIRIDEARAISLDGYVDKKPKSKKGVRVVAVPGELLDLIREYRKSLDVVDERIFPVRPDHYSTYFGGLVAAAGLPDAIRFHDLRHYHASWLYDQGIPDQYAADRLGHDIQVLKGIYQHIGVDKERELDDKVRRLHLQDKGAKGQTVPNKMPNKK